MQFQFNGFNMMFPDHSRPFNNSYRCYSVSMLPGNERQDVEKGGKSIVIFLYCVFHNVANLYTCCDCNPYFFFWLIEPFVLLIYVMK